MFGPVPEEKVVDILTTLYLVGKEGKLTMHLAGECVDCWGCPWRIRPAATCRRKTGAAALDAVTAEEERKRSIVRDACSEDGFPSLEPSLAFGTRRLEHHLASCLMSGVRHSVAPIQHIEERLHLPIYEIPVYLPPTELQADAAFEAILAVILVGAILLVRGKRRPAEHCLPFCGQHRVF